MKVLFKLTLGVATLALAVASAASSYHVTLVNPANVGKTQLKPGDYKVEMNGSQAIFKSGRNTVHVPAKMEQNNNKYTATEIETNGSALQEIHIGGTKDKIVFSSSSANAGS
jgi:hypothetical protein